ncbi:MAG TPA: ABC transporter permease subunit [Lacipirellulaceae bacterium]|nr:ABC transporter permease subunit [Lacipirellulaceae bacterium]
MNRALFAKTISDARLLFVAVLALMFVFPWLFIWVSSKISLPAFSDFIARALPEEMQRIWGVPVSEVATPAGRVALVWVHPLVILGALVWTIARGSDCVSGEIGRGTMEMLLAQPVRRISVFATQAIVTILGSALLAAAAWCGTAAALFTTSLYEQVPVVRFIPPAVNLFTLMVCLGGMTALLSSWDNQRWRTVGIMGACYVVSASLAIAGQISDRWHWLRYASFLSLYKPQTMVAHPDKAWSLFMYANENITTLGLGGCQLLLFGIGVACYAAGAVIFTRREIPAPI